MSDKRARMTRKPPGLNAPWSRPIIKLMSRLNTWIYRMSKGRIGSRFVNDAPVLLLTTIGRKSGKERTTPVLYLEDGSNLVVVASQGGMDRHPLWYLNLRANPEVSVQVGEQRSERLAHVASEQERLRLWPQLVAMYPDFDSYQSWTEREIPVVVLAPR